MTRPPTKHDDLDGARGLLTVFVCGLIFFAWLGYNWYVSPLLSRIVREAIGGIVG